MARGFAEQPRDYEASLAIRERLAAADPTNATWRKDAQISRRDVAWVKALK